MTDKEQRDKEIEEFQEYCKQQYPILQEKEKNFNRSAIKTWKESYEYWHNIRITMLIFNDTITDRKYSMAEYYRDAMRLCVECLEESKNISKEIHKKWYDYFACMNMDFVGEAHCKVGTPYYPTYEYLAEGEEKKIWEEIIELGSQYYELKPENI